MNILYITKLTGNLWAGPNNSVPAQIKAQNKIDNCFWYNMNSVVREEWRQDGLDCKCRTDYPSGRLYDLPYPFNKPDIAVIEEVYCFFFERIILDLIYEKIPYVIVPRSTLTIQAQRNKPLKKFLGNFLWFNRMIDKSIAIQYLTEQEKLESESRWIKDGFIIPNGVDAPKKLEIKKNNKEIIKVIYIGRIEIYQKGFDSMIEAINRIKNTLRQAHFQLEIYGPNRDGAKEYIESFVSKHKINDLISIHEAVFDSIKKQVLQKADVFIMTSRFEGMPMGMIEALSYGLPCIATRGTNLTDVITEYNAGWVAENTVDSIVDALERMVADKRSFEEKSNNAIFMAKKYSWSSIAKDTHSLFKSIIND